MADDRLFYFAYGSNMCTRYLHEYCPAVVPVMPAAPANFHIEFRRFSTNLGGGISTIQPAPGEIVHGQPDDDLAPHRGFPRRIATAGP